MVLAFSRPPIEPPEGLSESEKRIFRDIVATKPSDYFSNETVGLLVNMVRGLDAADKISSILNSTTVEKVIADEGTAGLARLLAMREKQSRLVVSIATRLRLTPQSRYSPVVAATIAKTTPTLAKPWLGAAK